MSLFSGQFIEVIEWLDSSKNTIVYRFPDADHEIKMGAQLTVRESQTAIFVNEGVIADVFGPGRYELTTNNLPVLTKLKSWQFGFDSPFKAEVYFISTRQFLSQRWGTKKPIMMRDPDFGALRFRAFGNYAFRVADPQLLLREIVGTNPNFTTETIGEQFKTMIQSVVADVVVSSKVPALDLAARYEEFSQTCFEKLTDKFKPLGFELLLFQIENISLPSEVEEMLDKRTGVGIMSDSIGQYAQLQAADSIRDAAKNGHGYTTVGMGMGGMGMGMGFGMADAFDRTIDRTIDRAMNSFDPPSDAKTSPGKKPCVKCGELIPSDSRFCPKCGAPEPLQSPSKKCVKCGAAVGEGDRFCPACGTPQAPPSCPNCKTQLAEGARFCPQCGTKIG